MEARFLVFSCFSPYWVLEVVPYLSNYVIAAVYVLRSLTTRVIIISHNYRYRDEKYLGGIYSRNRRRAIRRTPLKREAG